jgi:hypothetical protein
MSTAAFRLLLVALAAALAVAVVVLVVPPFLRDPDPLAVVAAAFVNPYAAAFSLDAVLCWLVLAVWVAYEAKVRGVRRGWVALVLGLVPGVAAGFAAYLLLRLRQERES